MNDVSDLAFEINQIFGNYTVDDICKALEQVSEWGYEEKVESVITKLNHHIEEY
jgi:hypothetical protein